MNKFIVAGMVALASASSAFAMDKSLETAIKAVPQLNENCSASVIYSERDAKSGEVETLLITAKHCVADAEKYQMNVDFFQYAKNKIVKKDRFIGHVKGTSYNHDLALIQIDDKNTLFENVNKIAPKDADIKMGDDTVAIGYPFGLGLTFTEGKFMSQVQVDWPEAGKEYFRSTPDIGPGNSGGALLRKKADGSFEQIGVTTAVITGFPFMGLFTDLDDIHEYLSVAAPEALGKPKNEAQTTGTKVSKQ